MSDRQRLLEQLDATVNGLIDFYNRTGDTSGLANTAWTVRDVLVHIVFWHESFARNVSDLARGVKPKPLRGTYAQLALRSGEEFVDCTIDEMLDRLITAQRTISELIDNPNIELIPYKVGSRSYAPAEHLSIVRDHIQNHLKKLREIPAAADR